MTQLALLEQPVKLTDRQQEALRYLQDASPDGLTGQELGTQMGVGPTYAKANGLAWLRALKRKGLARQRKGGIWVAVNPEPAADTSLLPGMTDEIPY